MAEIINMGQIDVYLVMGKVAPNEWRLINEIYDEFKDEKFEFYYLKQAELVRRDLKNYLNSYRPKEKVPLTIVKTLRGEKNDKQNHDAFADHR